MNQRKRWALAVGLALSLGTYAAEVGAAPVPINSCTTIAQPGLHVLTQNIAAVGNCLVVNADFVTLDFRGFGIRGDGTGSGVTDTVGHQGTTIRNGILTNFSRGIWIIGAGTTVERMRVIDNLDTGIFLGVGSIVNGNLVFGNGGVGISAGTGSAISNNTARANGGNGINALTGSTVSGNTVHQNTGTGIEAQCPAHVVGNTAVFNNVLPGIVEVFAGFCVLEHNLIHP